MQEFFDKLVALFVAMQDVKILIASILFVLALTVFYYFIIKFLRVNGAKIAETVFVCIFCFCASVESLWAKSRKMDLLRGIGLSNRGRFRPRLLYRR